MAYPYKSSHIDFLQIGAHIGDTHNDPLFPLPLLNRTVILVEPVPFLYRVLKHSYREKIKDNEIEFLNIAVSDRDGSIDMIVPSETNDLGKFPFFLNQMASTTDKYIKHHKFEERFPDFKYETITVPCRTLTTLCRERGITSIGRLFVDTEGHDETILRSFDFSLCKPYFITFENCYMDEAETPLAERYKYQAFNQFLFSHGYELILEDENDTTVVLTAYKEAVMRGET